MPSPAMVVALIALFVALGGASYAVVRVDSASIKNNSVRSADLKNNDVRGTDIRRGTIKGSDVGTNALGGADILESALGKVAKAASADKAAVADKLSAGSPSAAAISSSSDFRVVKTRLLPFESDTLVENGPVRLVAKCDKQPSGEDRVRILADTSTPNAFLDGGDDHDRGTDLLQPGTAEDNREMSYSFAPSGIASLENDLDDGFVASSEGHWIGIHGEALGLGLNVYGSKCSVIAPVFLGKL